MYPEDNGSFVDEYDRVDFPQFLDEAVEIWDEISDWWDDKIGDGNDAQDELIEPTQERLLDIKRGERLLDIACGAGRFTRRMAELGASITALDHSAKFIARARKRSQQYENSIDFHVVNAADASALLALPSTPFDAAVCTMGIMDMAVITPLARSLTKLLRPGGRFVFSVMHPAFNSNGSRNSMEREYNANGVQERFGVWVPEYLKSRSYTGIGIVGQPRPHIYFHRPINLLLRLFLDQGFRLSAFEEPRFSDAAISSAKSPLSSEFWRYFPLILVVRLELPE